MENSSTHDIIQELESPFIHLTSFKQRESESTSISQNAIPIHRPFKSVYELEGIEQGYNTDNEALVELMNELYDEDFDEFLQEIAYEARELYETNIADSFNGMQNNEAMVKQSLEDHFSPLLNEVDRFMDFMIGIAEEHDVQNMTDEEWDGLVDQYVPEMEVSPRFEDFGGWFKKKWKKAKEKLKTYAKKAKNLAKKGLKYAKKKAVAYALRKIKKYAGTFLKKAVGWALDKVPARYRPIAKLLAKKLGVLKETTDYEDYLLENNMQHQLDGLIAHLLLDSDESELEIFEQEFLAEENELIDNSINQLDEARENFIRQLGELEEGEDATPLVENFAPAIMMAIRLGIRFYGRDKLIGIVARPVSKLIAKYIGNKYALILANLLVDSGLKMFNLELSPEQQVEEGNRAIAAVVEDTIRQIAKLPEHVLRNEALLESNVIQAFETAAKTNFPDDILPEETFIKRPDLREASKHKVAWKMKTYGKGKIKKCRYKKLNKEIETTLTSYQANEIKTYGGVSLAKMLRDQMGVVVNRNIPIKVHLYETLPGADRFHIGRNESMFSRMANLDNRAILQQIHPLTSVASGLLLGEPALGCKSKTKCLAGNTSYDAHRYYYLEIPGARPQIYATPSGMQYLRKTTGLKVKFNFIKNQIQLFLFLSETDTQNIAGQMRQRMEGNAARLGIMMIKEGLKTVFSRHTRENIMIVHPNVIPGKASGTAINYVPSVILNALKYKLKDWTAGKLSDYFMNQVSEFIQAADADADGVTICLKIAAPADFHILGKLISSKKVQIPENIFSENNLEMDIKVKPGYRYV